jgi:hypothetical protein
MFGMLDYRARKLYWLLTLPFVVVAKLSFYAALLASIIIAEHTSKSVALKIVIAYVATEVISLLLSSVFWRLVFGAIKKMFFFFIDVLPAHGANAEEAKEVVLQGDFFLLDKKLSSQIEHWTEEDTRKFVPLAINWRARTFFGASYRFAYVVDELKRIHQETGKEPFDVGYSAMEKVREGVKGGHITLLEKIIVPQPRFNSLVGLTIIIFAVFYLAE